MRISDWSSDVCSSDLLHIILEPVGDAIENPGAVGGRDPCPLILGGVRRIERALDIFRRRQRKLGDLGAIDRARVREILAARWSAPSTTDEIIIAEIGRAHV